LVKNALCNITGLLYETLVISRQRQLCGYFVVPPSLTFTFDDQTVIEGDAVSVSCTASGIPEPTYMFTKVSLIESCQYSLVLITHFYFMHIFHDMHKRVIA